MEPFNLDVEPWSETIVRNLYEEPLCEAFIRNLHDKPFCEMFMWNLYAPLCGTSWDLFLEPWNLYLWNLGTRKSGTCTWNLGELELLRVEPWGNLNFWEWNLYVEPWGAWTFTSGTFMSWKLGEPAPLWELLRVEPLFTTDSSSERGIRHAALMHKVNPK